MKRLIVSVLSIVDDDKVFSMQMNVEKVESTKNNFEAFRCKCKLRLRSGFSLFYLDDDFSKLYRRTGVDFIAAVSFLTNMVRVNNTSS